LIVFAPDIRNWSIKNKLKAVIILTSLAVLLVLFLVFVLTQRNFLRNKLLQEMDVLARNLANNCAASVIFGDHRTANETLESLKANPQVAIGIIYDTEGRIFSSYHQQETLDSPTTYPSPALLDAGHLFSRHHLDSIQTIGYGSEELGLLYLRANLKMIENTLLRYIGFGFMGLGGAFVLAWILASRLQRVISQPIEQLAAAMKSVSKERNYSQRVKMESHDELGSLIDDFNEMLVQIEMRDQELRNKQNRLDYLAHHDTLTNLPNRLLFQDRLRHAISKARRMQQIMALLFLDLDRFKNINDSLGHEVGDQVLQEVAKRLTNIVRESDTLARLGGDEFVIALEQNTESRELTIVAQKILETLSTAFHIDTHELYITASIGISLYPANGLTPETLMKTADVAMYRAKEKGRNNFQFFALEMNERAHQALFLENNLRKAIDNQELALYYQPQVEITTGKTTGMEALIRWHHPTRGVIPPDKFIPMAEETGLIIPIGKWVINTACQQTMQWQQAGFPPCKVAVNISPRQFRQSDLVETVAQALDESGLAACWLELEITENVLVEDVAQTITIMESLNSLGVSLAIDDFGTGYSSLSYLHRFPLSKLKIDRSFVQSIGGPAGNQAIVEAIIALACALDLEVIAEGIENQEQIAFLKERGCFYGQGFYFSRPLPVDACEQFLLQERIPKVFALEQQLLP
jgi:diguanylate cyclase (GGDEF)-like protein